MISEFVLTDNHITLLRASYVDDEISDVETGAACIDPKRPYGSKDVPMSIAKLIHFEVIDDEYVPESERCERLHAETPIALQIVLSTGSFVPGTYRLRDRYDSRSWYLVGDPGVGAPSRG